jgi:F420-non-reducing hydrogenase iron-sulfur subunit
LGFDDWDLKIIVFTCNWNAYSGLETAGCERLSLPAGVRSIKVMCLGRLHPGLVLKAFELGADGVLMLGCPPGGCHYEFGNSRAEELFEETRALTYLLGIGEERLRLDWVAAGDGAAFAEKVLGFVEEVRQAVGTEL